MYKGWRTSPTARSVVDKQASAMLDLVRSCGLVFTATINRMLKKIMKGQVRALTTILAINTACTSGELFAWFRRKRHRLKVEDVVLNVVLFIFARFWLVKASSLCVVQVLFFFASLLASLIFVNNWNCLGLYHFLLIWKRSHLITF